MKKPCETDLVKAVIGYLSLRKFLVWRNNSGAKKIGSHFVRWGKVGSGDVLAVKDGRFYSIECKMPGNRPTPAQEQWADEVRAAGGVALVVRSLGELIEALERTES